MPQSLRRAGRRWNGRAKWPACKASKTGTERSVSYVDPAIRRPMSVQDRRIRLSAEATLVLAPPIETVIRETHQ